MCKIINTGSHCAKLKSVNLEKGTVVVRFSWDSLCWRKMEIVSVNLFGELIIESSKSWEKGTKYRILTRDPEKELNDWIPVVTILPDGDEADPCKSI